MRSYAGFVLERSGPLRFPSSDTEEALMTSDSAVVLGCEQKQSTRRSLIKLKTLLNQVHKIKGFVYTKIQMVGGSKNPRIIAEVRPRRGSNPLCSGCGKPGPGYDRMAGPRQFAFVPILNIPVFLSYTMRRVDCPKCGVKVERVPWADGKHSQCNVFRHFLATWAKRLSWKETAECFGVKWDAVRRSVQWVVAYGLKHRSLDGIEALGVDEVAYSRGHKYMTLVYQIDAGKKRLIGVLKERTTQSLKDFFTVDLGAERCAKIKVVCSDMWKPYLKVIAEVLPSALNLNSGVAHGDSRQSVGLQRLVQIARRANRRAFGFNQAFSLQHLSPPHPRSTPESSHLSRSASNILRKYSHHFCEF